MSIGIRTPRLDRGLSYRWLVVIVVTFGAFMSVLDQTIVNIAIPRRRAYSARISNRCNGS